MGRKWSEIAWCGGWLFTELHKPPSVNGLELRVSSCDWQCVVQPSATNTSVCRVRGLVPQPPPIPSQGVVAP